MTSCAILNCELVSCTRDVLGITSAEEVKIDMSRANAPLGNVRYLIVGAEHAARSRAVTFRICHNYSLSFHSHSLDI